MVALRLHRVKIVMFGGALDFAAILDFNYREILGN
jgi:hypothetical protein